MCYMIDIIINMCCFKDNYQFLTWSRLAANSNTCIQFSLVRRGNEILQAETQMFEKYLKRVEPKDLVGIQPGQAQGLTPSQSAQDVIRGMGRKRSKSRSSNIDRSLRLSAEQKCDIAQREIEELKDEIDKLKEESEKVLDTYKV